MPVGIHSKPWGFLFLSTLLISAFAKADDEMFLDADNPRVYFSYHWHLHQPIYWPQKLPNAERVQRAADSFLIKRAGGGIFPGSPVPHPQNNLLDGDIGSYDPVFSKEDRVRIYQERARDSLGLLSFLPWAGASASYSGALMDNVESLAEQNLAGYSFSWNQPWIDVRHSKTPGGHSKMDLVGFNYHHSLAPLLPRAVFKKELEIAQSAWRKRWGGSAGEQSYGYFPTELCFSQTLIPVLKELGYHWSYVANGHLARSTQNYLDMDVAPSPSSSTWNTNPPNRADMTNPAVPPDQWWSGTLDGRGAKVPAPFAYQVHTTAYVDPETGEEQTFTIVPADDVLGYMNGYGPIGTDIFENKIAPFSSSSRPSLVVMAHDGDNAWAGGYSYYYESVPGFARAAADKNIQATTIEDFLAHYPPPANERVHIEDGGWVNPEGDWGDPQYVKWLYPPARSPHDPGYNPNDPRTRIDIEGGFSNAVRAWAVVTAGANWMESAEEAEGPSNADHIMDPSYYTMVTDAEKAWHFFLSGLDSGFLYFGDSLDDPVKYSLALDEALPYAQTALSRATRDKTGPTIFRPQRYPWNPGGKGWGVTTGYKPVGFNGAPPFSSDFYVWTLAYDVSGIQDLRVKYRVNFDGTNSPTNMDNKTYRGGPTVGPWTDVVASARKIDPTFTGDPPNSRLNYFIQPRAIADLYYAKITGLHQVLVDYYIEAVDNAANLSKSDIFHVWVD